MSKEKYGFVYIWRDRKRNMYYIGCRWGNINDGYICSSNRMRDAFYRRPDDFKRKILKTDISDRKQTLVEEYYYLSMIKDKELGVKYYNLNNKHFGHWSTCDKSILTIGEKISISHKSNPDWGKWAVGKVVSEETKEIARQNNKKQFENLEQREMRRKKALEQWLDSEYRKINTENKKGKKQSQETIKKRLNTFDNIRYDLTKTSFKKGHVPHNKGKQHSLETKQKLRNAWIKRKQNKGKI